IDRTGMLTRTNVLILRSGIIEDLDLHSGIGDVPLARRSQPNAAIAALWHLVFEPQLEVVVLFFRQQPTAADAGREHDAVLGAPRIHLATVDLPTAQVLAVEDGFKSFRRLVISGPAGRQPNSN